MSYRGEGTAWANPGVLLPVLVLISFPLEVLRFAFWMWITGAAVVLMILMAALVVRALIVPYTNPDLYRLVTQPIQRPSLGKY